MTSSGKDTRIHLISPELFWKNTDKCSTILV